MSKDYEFGGDVLVVDGSIGELTPTDAAERLERSVFAALRTEYADFRTARARAHARVCIAAAYAKALNVPRYTAHSHRDYSVAMLGVKYSSFRRWARIGEVLLSSAPLRSLFTEGRVTASQLDALHSRIGRPASVPTPNDGCGAASLDPTSNNEHGEMAAASTSNEGHDDKKRLSIAAPIPAVLYMEDSLRLARAFVGTTTGDEEALSALLAEASTESSHEVDGEVAERRFRLTRRRSAPTTRENGPLDDAAGDVVDASAIESLAGAGKHEICGSPLERLILEAGSLDSRRRTAFRIHSILRRLIGRRDRLAVRHSELLFEWRLEDHHNKLGFRNFERFGREVLGLPPSTCNDLLRRARLRRYNNAIALASASGRISSVQTEILESAYRRCGIASSDLEKWCEYAATHTVRRLRDAIRWAKREADLDYRRWSLDNFRPPEEEELRTLDTSLESLVRESRTADLDEALISWETAPRSTLTLHASADTLRELAILAASLQEEIRSTAKTDEKPIASRRIPVWLAVCRVFHRARESWRVHHRAPAAPQRRILDRDGYRCAAPDCTGRKNLQVHHVTYRSRGGTDDDSNRVTLCAFHHHHGEHGGLLRVRGELDDHGRGLTWEMGLDSSNRAMRVYKDEMILVAAS